MADLVTEEGNIQIYIYIYVRKLGSAQKQSDGVMAKGHRNLKKNHPPKMVQFEKQSKS